MIGRTLRVALVAATMLTIPAASARACHLFDRCCGRATTYYAPYVASYAPTCCAQPQVVNYVPQTCYRTVYVNAPVVAYRPTTACDACGRATTVMRPVTTYVTQARMVPYTTYRAVVAPAQPCCGAAPVTSTYAPAVSTVPAAPAAPACCTPASATYTPTPTLSTYTTPAPSSPITTTTPVPAPSTTPAPLTPYPSPAEQPADGNKTFEPSPSDATPGESRMLLPPSNAPSSSTFSTRPHGLDPDLEDRTTAIPLRNSRLVRQASLVVPQAETPRADNGGWRAQ